MRAAGLAAVLALAGGLAAGAAPAVVRPCGTDVCTRRTLLLGRSVQGRPIHAVELGNPASKRKVLVVGCIHGTECAGIPIVRALAALRPPADRDLWLVANLNPDGLALGTRTNADGVDLNRNFPSGWRPIGARGDPQYAGPHPFSAPERGSPAT